jgi:shikimate kinase
MGSGKSYSGQRLAQLLDVPFIDLDDEIERMAGKTISEIFSSEGEDAFRELEKTAVRNTLDLEAAVIATGGGAPCFHDSMEWMNGHGTTVFLDPSVDVLLARLEAGRAHRPLLQSAEELRQQVTTRLAARRPIYEKAILHLQPTNPNADVARLIYDELQASAW